MPGVVNVHALRQQPFPAALAPAREGSASTFRAHPGAKTMLVFAGALRALKSAFHDVFP